jgi:hypothetical protein
MFPHNGNWDTADRPYSVPWDSVLPSSPASQPFAASDLSGSGTSQFTHRMMRLPLPPGGSARIIVAPQVGQVLRRPLPMQ